MSRILLSSVLVQPRLARFRVRAALAAALVAVTGIPQTHANAQGLRRDVPTALTDAEFWSFFTTMSEPGGSFSSENLVSNEITFQHVIPTLQRTLAPGGVYLGVGPEQNFTYIANIKPRMAVIVDIRRQNAMQHLMYKALFELSPTRRDFVSRLFSRPLPASLGSNATPAALFEAASAAPASDSAFAATADAIINSLTVRHRFALSGDDIEAIRRVYGAFHNAGPGINYGNRTAVPGSRGSTYATYATLQTATNADSVAMSFLSTEDTYRWMRDLEGRNLVVPVVGNFAGPTAIRAVGDYFKARRATVTAFYLSNVEQYLFQDGIASQFYRNVETLPLDSTSTFIRSVPGAGGGMSSFMVNGVGGGSNAPNVPSWATSYSVSVNYANGIRTTRTVFDSAGQQVAKTTVDTLPNPQLIARMAPPIPAAPPVPVVPPVPPTVRSYRDSARVGIVDSLRGLAVSLDSLVTRLAMQPQFSMVTSMGGGLQSGLASIAATLAAFNGGRLPSYNDVVRMTKVDWKK